MIENPPDFLSGAYTAMKDETEASADTFDARFDEHVKRIKRLEIAAEVFFIYLEYTLNAKTNREKFASKDMISYSFDFATELMKYNEETPI